MRVHTADQAARSGHTLGATSCATVTSWALLPAAPCTKTTRHWLPLAFTPAAVPIPSCSWYPPTSPRPDTGSPSLFSSAARRLASAVPLRGPTDTPTVRNSSPLSLRSQEYAVAGPVFSGSCSAAVGFSTLKFAGNDL